MTKYTPTTGQVRVAYQDHQDFQAVIKGLDRPGDVEAGHEFDRWLAQHDAEVKAEAVEQYKAAQVSITYDAPRVAEQVQLAACEELERHVPIENLELPGTVKCSCGAPGAWGLYGHVQHRMHAALIAARDARIGEGS